MLSIRIICASICLSLILASCNFNETYSNRTADKEEGQRVTQKLYKLLKENRFDETHTLFSHEFFAASDTADLNGIYRSTIEELGNIKKSTLLNAVTEVVTGTSPSAHYSYVYEIEREDGVSTEKIHLIKEGNEIKILSLEVHLEEMF